MLSNDSASSHNFVKCDFSLNVFRFFFQFTSLNIDEPMFQPFPSDIVFQNYEPYETYQVPLRLRNNDKVSKLSMVPRSGVTLLQVVALLGWLHHLVIHAARALTFFCYCKKSNGS